LAGQGIYMQVLNPREGKQLLERMALWESKPGLGAQADLTRVGWLL
jgi:hypothetical protein